MTRSFHVALHVLPEGVIGEDDSFVEGTPVKRLQLSPQSLMEPLPVSFESAVEQLAALPRMFVEPDGSFVWVSDREVLPWQLNGVLFDGGGRLQYVELRGSCSEDSFVTIANICGSRKSRLAIQLMQQAIFLSEAAFRRHIWNE